MDGPIGGNYDACDDPEQEQPPGAAPSSTSATRPTASSPTAAAAAEGSVGMSPVRRAQQTPSTPSVEFLVLLGCLARLPAVAISWT